MKLDDYGLLIEGKMEDWDAELERMTEVLKESDPFSLYGVPLEKLQKQYKLAKIMVRIL